jgi:Fic family protein
MNRRQQYILDFIDNQKQTTAPIIHEYMISSFAKNISRLTINRDINLLLKKDLIKKEGKSRNTTYLSAITNPLLKRFDVKNYFKDDNRDIKSHFSFEIFDNLGNLFSDDELAYIEQLNKLVQNNIKELPQTIFHKELERLTVEFSWKSSRIEGNTYSLLDTEFLIKQNIKSDEYTNEEAIMILNHKEALENIIQKPEYYQKITLLKIEELHKIIINNIGEPGLRNNPVGIIGTEYRPLRYKIQIEEAMNRLTAIINTISNPFEKALIAVLMISYIQPFQDGNKRTARIVANAILFASNYCLLSYRSVNEVEYKKSIILFYEQHSVEYFKKIFIEQFSYAANNYFQNISVLSGTMKFGNFRLDG